MPKIDYLKILKDAWNITWKHKYLFWYGLFISLASGAGNLNYNFDSKNNEAIGKTAGQFQNFVSDHLILIVTLAAIMFLVIIIFLVLSIIGRGSLIASVKKILRGEESGYKIGIAEGKKYFWKLFSLGLVLVFLTIACVIVLALPVIFLVANKSYALGILLGIVAVLIFIPILVLIAFLKIFGQLYIVLGKLGVRSALEQASHLFQKNILASIIMGLLFFPISLALMLAVLALLIPILIVFGLMASAAYFLIGKIGAFSAIGIGTFVFILGVLALRAAYETFAQTVWVLFFHEIASPKKEERAEEVIEELEREEKAVSTTEPANTFEIEK